MAFLPSVSPGWVNQGEEAKCPVFRIILVTKMRCCLCNVYNISGCHKAGICSFQHHHHHHSCRNVVLSCHRGFLIEATNTRIKSNMLSLDGRERMGENRGTYFIEIRFYSTCLYRICQFVISEGISPITVYCFMSISSLVDGMGCYKSLRCQK